MSVAGIMPLQTKDVVRRALAAIGYADNGLVCEDYVPFLGSENGHETSAGVPLVAFWSTPQDQFTSAIAVQWAGGIQDARSLLRNAATGLWAPFTLLALPDGCELWETLPKGDVSPHEPFRLLENVPSYEELLTVLSRHRHELEPPTVGARKRPWRQMALYEALPETNAFMQWAFRPTRERITKVFSNLLREALQLAGGDQDREAACLRWVMRMVGVRIAWDKKWFDDVGSRTSGHDILIAALRYPTRLSTISDLSKEAAHELAELVVTHLGAIHLGAVDGGLLSQVFQGSGLPRSLQQHWKLYPTPPDIAWGMLESLPVETLSKDERRVWDGTCGTGTFLVTALDKLRSLVPQLEGLPLRTYLTSTVSGNELRPALADVTRIALDQALGAPAGPEWQISEGDVLVNINRSEVKAWRPTIIVGNPPFEGGGRTGERAATIVERYQDMLAPGGMLGVVAPRSVLSSDAGAPLRRQLLRNYDIQEVWELPGRVFPKTDTETAVLLARKRYQANEQPNAVIWRLLNRDRTHQLLDAAQQEDWLRTREEAIWPPLALHLDECFADFPRLRDFVPRQNRSQGITPGTSALEHGDVLDRHEPGAEPYLVGRTDMLPFYISWQHEPRWIRYDSPRLQWPRPEYAALFRTHKVLVSRHTTRGATWRIRAAVDNKGLFPSDRFIVLKPVQPLSLTFVASLLNSVLANAWLRLVNPAFSTRLDDLLALPVPRDFGSEAVRDVERLAEQLSTVWAEWDAAHKAQSKRQDDLLALAQRLTLELDSAIYRVYDIPIDLQLEIAEYLEWLGGTRPGFSTLVVARPPQEVEVSDVRFANSESDRIIELFNKRDEEGLSAAEEEELDQLVDRWQHAYTAAVGHGPLPARSRASLDTDPLIRRR